MITNGYLNKKRYYVLLTKFLKYNLKELQNIVIIYNYNNQ